MVLLRLKTPEGHLSAIIMANENIVIDLSEHYGDVAITPPEDRLTLLSFLPIFKRNWLPCTLIFISGLSASALVSFLLPGSSSYRASGKLLFQASDTQSELTGIAEDLDPLETTGHLANPLITQANLLTSGFLAEDVVENLDLKNEQGELFPSDYIRRNLTVEPLPSTDILSVSFQAEEPQRAAQVVNELMRLYRVFVEQEQKAEIVAAKKFVDEQLPRLKEDLNFASRALEEFKEENQVFALDRQADDITSLLSGIDRQLNDTQVALKASNVRIDRLSEQLNVNAEEALNLSTLNDTSAVQAVLQEFYAVETELARQSGLYLPQHPIVTNLQNQADELASLLQERINLVLNESSQISLQDLQLGSLKQSLLSELVQAESDRLLLETQLAAYSDLKRDFSNQAVRLPSLERKQFELELNLDNAQNSYNELLQRSQEIKLAEIQIDGNNYVQIIEEARPPKTITSTYNPILLSLGTIVSFILAVSTGLILDRIDKTAKTSNELIKLLGYPLLGLIPDFEKPIVGTLPIDMAMSQESLDIYRSVYSSLKVTDLETSTQVIAITSAVHHEGKSEVAANLAKAISQSRRRVLLIDADLKTPVQHQIWQVSNELGLSHLLSGASGLDAAIHQIDSFLSIMSAGLPVAEPSLFFESASMKDLIHRVKSIYDYIIFDASPILAEPDALLLGRVSEGIIFVSQPKYVQKADILAARHLIEQAKLAVMGLVVNRVSRDEQKGNRIPFSHAYQTAENNSHYSGKTQGRDDGDGVIPHKASDKVLSNLSANGRGRL